MAPGYAELAKELHEDPSVNVVIAKLDATVHKTVSTAHGVQGFPTLKFFINGNAIDYQGAREKDDIKQWILKKTGPSSRHLETDEDYETHSKLKISVMLYYPKEDEAMLKTYQSFAAGYDDVMFAHTTNDTHAQKHEITQKYGMIVFRTFDEGHKFLLGNEPFKAE